DLFTYTSVMLDPEENGAFGVGSNGTGPFEMVEFEASKRAAYRKWPGYWGAPAHVDSVEFIDFGDDPNAAVAALAS
ncbi:ABC transporter substrate-binding protein, partial [Acinetobacter baumannii]|uniref:ABC transporter substrate-binding protein n=1 Tax=Acinetobacter baumannii TaxID=470 RepID=UPI001C08A423